jgi:4-hydroxybenzoate polyprenyltransferase
VSAEIALAADSKELPPATWSDYVALARPSHWIKHVFILPGVALAYLSHSAAPGDVAQRFIIGLVSVCLAASANYVINEWLDAGSDRHHPSKSKRPAVAKSLSRPIVVLEYVVLAALALLTASLESRLFLYCTVAFLVSGIVYNVAPIRTKDRAYLDVLSEAVNNPIRLTLGWAMVSPTTLPPGSLVLGYWMGGAFLMAIKRMAEYREARSAGGLENLGLYRRSFAKYTDIRLLISAFLYAQLAAFFLAVFLVKYRIEYLLSLPVFAALFATYLHVGLKPGSTAQEPENLLREKGLVVVVLVLVGVLAILTWIDIPLLDRLAEPHLLRLGVD